MISAMTRIAAGRMLRCSLTFGLLSTACMPAANVASPSVGSAGEEATDTALFAAVVRNLVEEGRVVPVQIDPRPLRPDPALVEVSARVGAAVPDLVRPVSDPFVPNAGDVLRRRRTVLHRLGISQTDFGSFPSCPGGLVPPEMRATVPPGTCPPRSMISAVIALARPGGAYLPRGRDERASAPPDAWSVRVIRRDLGPKSAIASASDYVARRDSGGGWKIVAVVPLLVVE